MFTVICITILAYAILGKDINSLLAKVKDVDWKAKVNDVFSWLKPYALKVGRVAAKPLVTFYYVMNDDSTTTLDRVLVYAALLYTVSPISLIPAAVYHFLGVLDEGAAIAFAYKRIKNKITPEIKAKVDATLDEWFGVEYAEAEVVANTKV